MKLTHSDSAVEEAYRRVARLHYAFSNADTIDKRLHQRAIDDLIDVLDPAMPGRPVKHASAPSDA